jgi:alanyl-tRNA synthetase
VNILFDAFELHDTHGLPLDVQADIAANQEVKVNLAAAAARRRLKAKTDLEAAGRRHHGRRHIPEILKISAPLGSR